MTTLFEKRFKDFFKKNHTRITQPDVVICLGNEGADIDSFISSLVVAFAEDCIHVINMRKEVFKSKGDLMYLCDLFRIDTDDLIYLERPLLTSVATKQIGSYFLVNDVAIPLSEKRIKLILTDHNEPVDELREFEVTMVIDHHRLENKVEQAKRIYIDVDVGSATTLVAKYLGDDLSRKHHCIKDPKNTDPEKVTLCESIAKLLLIPIVIDTSHLKRRTSVFDSYEYKRLKRKAGVKKLELKTIRKNIQKARINDSKIATDIILQKDFKKYIQDKIVFGIATVKYNFEDWIEREGKNVAGLGPEKIGLGLWVKLDDFRRSAGLDFLMVGCNWRSSRRFIIINFPLIELFARQNDLSLTTYKGVEMYIASEEQSRKNIAPKIREFLSKISFKK
ncbi:hypothetical protein EDEG_03702 [Edhazardia aedis USNM 41457]|uniref:inorganic diphosphatase n=1 Tax=Edhazardia aedis (strain USNM 41457) TaxID=1003232 RepID=J9DKA8_EDHAE|nr:hypothetical protein EDEG_03702 [Edhazardia aedis USNM 41457]|eukprot:EJW01812.1 hypothetical protein EDEG_03702 [Edhazardia aedis USNM 41457]